MLIVLPWFITTQANDPFLNQNWIVFALAALSICILSVVFLFFRPRNGHFVIFKPLLLIFVAIASSMYFSEYLITLRTSLLWLSLLLLLAFLRLSRRQTDNRGITLMFSVAGFAMSIYSLAQKCGWDFFHWGSPYKMVGTLSNPNYLGAYLMLTAIVTLGMAIEGSFKRTLNRSILFVMFLVQAVAILLSGAVSATVGLLLALLLFSTRFWEVKPGRIIRFSPFLSGAIIAVVLTILHGIVFYSTSNYPWENLAKPPYSYLSIVSRLVVWQMGYSVFLAQPLTGLGPGAIMYLMPVQRPPYATALGLKIFNDDPHSAVVSLLAETGIFGLFAFSALFCYLAGISIWRRSKGLKPEDAAKVTQENQTVQEDTPQICWLPALIPAIIVFLGFKAGFINLPIFFYSIPVIIAFIGIYNSLNFKTSETEKAQTFEKTPLVALLAFIFHSAFNNNISVLPLLATATVLASLLLSNNLKDLVWKKKFSPAALPYLCMPLIFVFTAYSLQSAYQHEQLKIFAGSRLLEKGKFIESQRAFESAIKTNPQSPRAYFGLAISLKNQGQYNETQSILEKLDQMVPNIFNTNYELARVLFERKHILEAHRYALKSLNWNPTPRSYELLGKILISEGKMAEAKKIFEEGLIFVPEQNKEERIAADRIRLNLAALAANQTDFAECRKYLAEIKSSISQTSDALYLKGMLLSQDNKPDEALKLFEKALHESPENPRIMNAVGYLLTRNEKDLERAEMLLETAHQLLKSSETPMLSDMLMIAHSLGTLYWKQGKLEEAGKLLEIAWEKCPDTWETVKVGRYQDLIRFYQETGNDQALARLTGETASTTPDISGKESTEAEKTEND